MPKSVGGKLLRTAARHCRETNSQESIFAISSFVHSSSQTHLGER